jgi:hypothetical protein
MLSAWACAAGLLDFGFTMRQDNMPDGGSGGRSGLARGFDWIEAT